LFADALALLLTEHDEIQVIGAAHSAEEALERWGQEKPDVVLMDVGLPRMDGIEATRRLRESNPDVQVVIITASQDDDVIAKAVDAGASGFVPKTYAADELVSVIKRAAAGEMVLPANRLLQTFALIERVRHSREAAEQLLGHLTNREAQILQGMADGRSTDGIAELLGISVMTVRTHIKSLMAKLGVHSRLEAVAMGVRAGFIRIPSTV
jgi:DNA-binding NarL/FixJ family response regulator